MTTPPPPLKTEQQELRSALLERAIALCQAFATKQPVDRILEHFSDDVVTCFEHGLPRLAPFLGRSFTGTAGARAYFELIGELLDFENMTFSEYMVDTETRQVSVVGRATFRYKATRKCWHEVFTYRLGFSAVNDSYKISSYQVWADSGAAHWASLPRRIVLVTYEFTYSPFSGNGILTRSIVKALLQLGCHVTVWCCRPFFSPLHDDTPTNHHHHLEVPEITLEQYERLTLIPLQLEAQHGWRKLDYQSAWEYFCYNNLDGSSQQLLQHCISAADAVCAVDWTGAHALRSFHSSSSSSSSSRRCRPPTVYFNFRVYSSGIRDQAKHTWLDHMEQQALKDADTVIALSEKDRVSLQSIAGKLALLDNTHVLLPPLRGDMHDLALQSVNELKTYLPASVAAALQRDGGTSNTTNQRRLITCVARLSHEKNALRFVHFLEKQAKLLCKEHNNNTTTTWIPLLAGAPSEPEYATLVKNELARVAPHAIIIDHFLDSKALCAIFAVTVLNFHPCSYDAYGMTAVEAAACGVPSVIAKGDAVGATALLQNACIPVDMPVETDEISEQAVQEIVQILVDPEKKLQSIGQAAQEKALAWDEIAYGTKLLDIISSVADKEYL